VSFVEDNKKVYMLLVRNALNIPISAKTRPTVTQSGHWPLLCFLWDAMRYKPKAGLCVCAFACHYDNSQCRGRI